LVRYGGYEVGFRRVEFLISGNVVQDNQIAYEFAFRLSDRRDVERHVLHLKIAFLVVGVDFQRFPAFGLRIAVKFPDEPAQQVVGKGDIGRAASTTLSVRLSTESASRFMNRIVRSGPSPTMGSCSEFTMASIRFLAVIKSSSELRRYSSSRAAMSLNDSATDSNSRLPEKSSRWS